MEINSFTDSVLRYFAANIKTPSTPQNTFRWYRHALHILNMHGVFRMKKERNRGKPEQPLWLFCTERRPAEPAGPFWAAHRAEPSSRVLCPVLACLAAPLCQCFRCGTFGVSRQKMILASRPSLARKIRRVCSSRPGQSKLQYHPRAGSRREMTLFPKAPIDSGASFEKRRRITMYIENLASVDRRLRK